MFPMHSDGPESDLGISHLETWNLEPQNCKSSTTTTPEGILDIRAGSGHPLFPGLAAAGPKGHSACGITHDHLGLLSRKHKGLNVPDLDKQP